ncbi:hypothetical protein PLESTF_000432800 [Pleodorina starrii]|nr:hypothetical protein PLESTF_000432800 [Pleodorina starrii]
MSGTLSQSSFQACRGNASSAAADTFASRPSPPVFGRWEPSYPLMARGFGSPSPTVETEFAISRVAMIESCGILSNMADGWMDKLRLAAQGPEAAAGCLDDDTLTAAVALRTMSALAGRLQTTLAMDHEGQMAAMQKTFPRLAEAVASQPDVPQLAPTASSSPDSRSSSCHHHAQEADSTACAAATTTLVSGRAARDDVLSGGSVGAMSSGDGDSDDDDDGDWDDGFHFPSVVPLSALGVVPRREPAALVAECNASRDLPAPQQRHVPALTAAAVAEQCKPVVLAAQSGSCGKGLTTQQRPQQQQQLPLTQQQRSRPLLSPSSAQQRSQAHQRPEWQRAQQPRHHHQAQAAKVPEAVMPTTQRRQTAATAKAQLAKAPPATSAHGQARTQRPQQPRQQAPQRPAVASSVEQPNSSSRPSYMRSTAASCAKALDRGVQQPPASAAAVEVKGCKARRVR